MKNKIIAFILSVSVVLTFCNIAVSAADEGYTRAERICIGLGCMKEEEYQQDKVLTRGEFAKMIAGLLSLDTDMDYSRWADSAYGDTNNEETAKIEQAGNFEDVDRSYPYYNEIMAVCNAGYMRGISEKRFAPEYDITVLEITKVLADMAGYAKLAQLNGGYPAGYEKTASEMGLLSGISGNIRAVATEETALKLIYNVLDVKMREVSISQDVVYEESSKTFMEGVLKIYKVRGAVLDNGAAAVGAPSGIRENQIKVSGVTAQLPDNMKYCRKYIGKRVDMYYTYDDDIGEYTAKYIELLESDISVTFAAEDFVSYKNGKITFAAGNKTVTKTISQNADMIFNNRFKSYYTADIFEFEDGDITLCATDGSAYNLIVINKYEFAYAEGVNVSESTIYNGYKSSSQTGINIIELTDEFYPDFIDIYDALGKEIGVEDIKTGDVLNILRCEGGIEITVSEETVSDFKLKAFGDADSGNGERKLISDGTREFEVLKSYYTQNNAVSFSVGETYKLFLNRFGHVVWMQKNENSERRIGIILKVYYDEDETPEGERVLTIYTDGGERKKFNVSEKIKFNGKRAKYKDLQSELNAEKGNPVLFETDSDGTITAVTASADYGEQNADKRGWCRINPPGAEYYFGGNGNDFDRFFYYVSGGTKVFTTPETFSAEEYADDANFSVGVMGFSDNQSYQVEAFASSPDSVEAEVIVYRKIIGNAGEVNTIGAFLISSVSYGLTDDDEEVLQLKGYQMNMSNPVPEYKVIKIDPDAIMVSAGDSSVDAGKQIEPDADINTVGPRVPQELEAGDIIRYETNPRDLVNVIRIAYDYSTAKAFCAGKSNSTRGFGTGSTYAGGVISRYGTGVRIATGKTPQSINYSDYTDVKNNIKGFRITNCPILVVEKKGKKIDVKQGTLDDLITYNDCLNDNYDRLAVLTYYTALTYGTVIYK